LALLATSLVLLTPNSVGAAIKHPPVRMPDLIGRSRVDVYRIMRNNGLYFVTEGPGSNIDRWFEVTAQSPRPGVEIKWHGEASLTVTNVNPKGPRAVPRLIDLTHAEALLAMRQAQLYFDPVGPGSSNGTWKVVLAQSVAPGTKVAWHAQISVRVAMSKPPAIKPVAPVATPPAVAAGSVINGTGFKIGVATWYNYVPGRCATWYLPKGTKITIRDLTTGKAITCIITDREWHSGNHVVDLSETQFAQLAPLWKGVISVKVTW
jgi:beta-lactam-binding protein with PASTA domain